MSSDPWDYATDIKFHRNCTPGVVIEENGTVARWPDPFGSRLGWAFSDRAIPRGDRVVIEVTKDSAINNKECSQDDLLKKLGFFTFISENPEMLKLKQRFGYEPICGYETTASNDFFRKGAYSVDGHKKLTLALWKGQHYQLWVEKDADSMDVREFHHPDIPSEYYDLSQEAPLSEGCTTYNPDLENGQDFWLMMRTTGHGIKLKFFVVPGFEHTNPPTDVKARLKHKSGAAVEGEKSSLGDKRRFRPSQF